MLEYLLLPAVGALIGYGTNLIAVRMLFRPREEVEFLGFRLQGLLPKRREELASAIGEVVEREFLNSGDVGGVFSQGKVEARMKEAVERYISNLRLNLDIPLIGDISFLLRDRLREELLGLVRKNSSWISGELKEMVSEDLNVKEMVQDKILKLDLERLEEIILDVAGKEVRYITYFGGLLGFLVGIAQAFLLLLLA